MRAHWPIASLRSYRTLRSLKCRTYRRYCKRLTPRNEFQTESLEPLDSVIVLGGGLKEDGSLPLWVQRRMDKGLEVLQSQAGRKSSLLCLGGGTPHKPPVISRGFVRHEATACAEYAILQGVYPDRILKEISSYDTVGNAYFAATIHAIPANWRRIAVVTSAFHMPRTRAIFETCFQLAHTVCKSGPQFELSFHAASDEGVMPDDVLQSRHLKEAESRIAWEKQASLFKSFKDLHQWLFATHLCYAVSRQAEFPSIPEQDAKSDLAKALASY